MRHFARLIAVTVAVSLLSTGCMLTRVVDRAFIGVTVRQPTHSDRKTTGIFLLPFAFAVDLVTSPIQALLIVILGDQFPFNDSKTLQETYALNESPQFQKLAKAQQAAALAEFNALLRGGKLSTNSVLALGEDGHWTVSEVSEEVRSQMLVRAGQSDAAAVCQR